MVTKRSKPRPTGAELEILNVLWRRGPSTVREVHAALVRTKPAGYTTTLKLMQIMAEKGLVKRDERQRAHVYAAQLAEGETQRQLVGELLERAFGGSAAKLLQHALASKKTSDDELAQIRQLLDEFERRKR